MNTLLHGRASEILDKVANLYAQNAPDEVPAGLLGYLYIVTTLSQRSSSGAISMQRRDDIRNHAFALMDACSAAPDDLKSEIRAIVDEFAEQEN